MTSPKSATLPDLNAPPPLGITAMDLQHKTDWRKMVRLECLESPGLSERDFIGLFARCDACGKIAARLVFDYHDCRPLGVDGLELTDCEE
jgi:hypothetical protein